MFSAKNFDITSVEGSTGIIQNQPTVYSAQRRKDKSLMDDDDYNIMGAKTSIAARKQRRRNKFSLTIEHAKELP